MNAKYNCLNTFIPQEKRKDINKKILYLIKNGLTEQNNLTAEIIYNSYTGDGGLHELEFDNYSSYHSYSEAKKKIENGQFFTGHNECELIHKILNLSSTDTILDLTAGSGNLFNFAPNEANCWGNELDKKAYTVCKYLYPKAKLTQGDMRDFTAPIKFDVALGNPPFNLKLSYNGKSYSSQMVYIIKSHELLKTGGILAIIVPKSFLNDDFYNKSEIETINNLYNFIGQVPISKSAFKNVGVENFQTKILILSKKSAHLPSKDYCNEFSYGTAEEIYNELIAPYYKLRDAKKLHLKMENSFQITNKDVAFEEKCKKLLFDIKRTKSITHKYWDCFKMYTDFHTQKKPESMTLEDWSKIKISKKDVLEKLKHTLSTQHIIERDEIRLVKGKREFYLKGYSQKSDKEIQNLKNNSQGILDAIIGHYNLKDKKYEKLVLKKQKEFQNQSIDFNSMGINKAIDSYLKSLRFKDSINRRTLKLNPEQLKITNKMLQKRYGYIQVSMGGGKTLQSIAYAMYRKEFNYTRNTLVLAPSIAINGTWVETLKSYGIDYIKLDSISDIYRIKKNDFILVTFDMLTKFKKVLKKYLKSIGYKITLVVDEADSISNIDSKRFKNTFSIGFKSKYKLLLSGTMTRNNIAESYPQFYLLYGSSINFLSCNTTIFKQDKETKQLAEYRNDYFNKPWPAYKKGLTLFKESFNPSKITVFGAEQNNQDIYNADVLKELINKTIITKTFEEIVGKKIYSIRHHLVDLNEAESNLYFTAINEFYKMHYLFKTTGNARKDSMLKIIQQLNTLLNICCNPQSYKEYESNEIPTKYKKVISLLKNFNDEYVAVGCRTLDEIDHYSKTIRDSIPNRQLFIITGTTSMTKRKAIIKEFKESQNGILLSTQQSLSSSISIEFVDKVIITALSWNWASLSQYFFRFIRYNSTREKEIHFVTYKNSIESNLLSLISSKEALNNFMKNESIDYEEINEELGISFDLIEMLLRKTTDKDGKTIISWGNQHVG